MDLERDLVDLGRRISYPEEPPLARRAAARLSAEHGRSIPSRSGWRLFALVTATLLILIAGVLGASPAARHAVANWLGIDGIGISFDHPSSSPVVGPGDDLGLGRRTTLDEARALAAFDVGVPTPFGPPDAVFFEPNVEGGEVSLVYEPRPGLPESLGTGVGAILTQFQGRVDRQLFQKFAVTGTDVEAATVTGADAFFIHGEPHLLYYDRNGDPMEQAPRLSGNVLLWEREGITYRLEAEVGKAAAISIASSVR
jgi:hypothetical protein